MRRESQTARPVLHALLVLALMLNGTAIPAAEATAADATTHAQHHGHDGMPDQAPADGPVGSPAPDCCDGKACGCGCTAPQAAALRLAVALHAQANSPANPVLVRAPHASGPIGAPFRPPT